MHRVQLDELVLAGFRNIARARIEPGPRFNVISGANGSGKTNLIEAIYLLGSLRSFRTTAREDLVRHGAAEGTVTGTFGEVNAGRRVEVAVSPSGKRVRSDGKAVGTDGAHFRSLPMVLFHPGMMELVQGGPEARRRFMDRALYQAEPTYPAAHRSYAKALASRNRLLKEQRPDRRALDPFSRQLAEHGQAIVEMRSRFVAAMGGFFAEAVERVGGGGPGAMIYRPRSAGGAEDLLEALAAALARDTVRGFTSVGPHADDLLFELDGQDARRFASQGQQRTAILGAKIAETRALTQATGRTPLLLLDDVSSELDRRRNRELFAFLSTVGGQVLITTTHADHIAISEERKDFTVESGEVTAA